MVNDLIIEIGINKNQQLYIRPLTQKFPMIYREAMEVNWDNIENLLYSPKPREWSYFDWFNQIIKAVKIQSCSLSFNENTTWVNISENLKSQILSTENKKV
jgi:hypothetical protein